MKSAYCIWLLLLAGCARAKTVYTGSTPANFVVRNFLDIPASDSIDFIRWNIALNNNRYELSCNYGIGKANTNGFIDGGRQLAFEGSLTGQFGYYTLQNENKTLKLLMLNSDLLQIATADGVPLKGTAGWNYTLSSITPQNNELLKPPAASLAIGDSALFVGRTPCLPYINPMQRANCYKLKWDLVLFADTATGQPKTFKLKGSLSYHQIQKGSCTLIKNKEGDTLYYLQCSDADLYLKAISPDVLVFTDKVGKPLVGNEDFSFTLNRQQ